MKAVTIEFKTKNGAFEDTFAMSQGSFGEVMTQLQYEKQFIDANIKSNTIKVNGKRLAVDAVFFKEHINSIKEGEGRWSYKTYEDYISSDMTPEDYGHTA